MDLRYSHKIRSSTCAELLTDRGHPGPKTVNYKCNYGTNVINVSKVCKKLDGYVPNN